MKSRVAILVTVLSTGLAGSAAGFAANRASAPLPPSAASTSVGESTPTPSATVPSTPPATPSRIPTTTAEPISSTTPAAPRPSPTPTATPAPGFSAKPVHSPEWDVSSLLTAGEFAKAGLPGKPSNSSRFSGFGQATMGNCEPGLTTEEGARAFFRADTYYDHPDGAAAYAAQMTARFPSSALARSAAQHIEARRTDCAAPWNGPTGPWTSTPVLRSTEGGASVATWTTTPPDGVGFETTIVVRSRSFMSVILVSGPNSWRDRIKASSMAASSAARLP